MAVELLALVKHDCPVCDQLLPALDAAAAGGAPLRILSQSSAADTAEQARRVELRATPGLDDDLDASERFDPDAVPTLILLDTGEERGRVEGLHRAGIAALADRAGVALALDGLPEQRPGCASITRDPEVAARLAVRRARAEGRLRSRTIAVGELEDPFEALHDRGLTDGLPVVPPTPERVVAMLDHTSRDPQELVGEVPPYGGRATVEKVAVNAVMAGCPPEALPVVLAAVEAACVESFALHGLVATTHPAGPAVIVSGPLAKEIGMNAGGNALGQGNRANVTTGRAQERGVPEGETGVTLVALEAPRIAVDQLARDPEGLCASLAPVLESVAHPKQRLAWDALLVVGPEHGRLFREAGWDRARVREKLLALTTTRAGDLVRGAGGSPEGIDPKWVSDPDMPVAKFASPERILLAYAGGDAGLFSMVYGTWAAGEIGSAPVTRSVEPWR